MRSGRKLVLSPGVAAWALLLLLAGCASGPEKSDQKPAEKSSLPLMVDEDAQRTKAIETRVQAGIEALKANDPERARRHISRALEIDRSSPQANNAMALLYFYEGDERREEEYFRRAIRADGDFSQARNNYAGLLYRQKRYQDAIEQLEKAANDPGYDQRALAFLNLGRCYAQLGQFERAASALQRSLRLDSQQVDALLEMADILLAQKNYREADSYMAAFQSRTRNTPRSLWIGIRIAAGLGDSDKQASNEFQLAKMFRESPEYAAWRTWKSGAADTHTEKRKPR
ncbi:MAG: type IV pilus biogenesis/stability protein PilW [Pseudomonadota bacterium]